MYMRANFSCIWRS